MIHNTHLLFLALVPADHLGLAGGADLVAVLRPDFGHVGYVALRVELEVVRLQPQVVDSSQ